MHRIYIISLLKCVWFQKCIFLNFIKNKQCKIVIGNIYRIQIERINIWTAFHFLYIFLHHKKVITQRYVIFILPNHCNLHLILSNIWWTCFSCFLACMSKQILGYQDCLSIESLIPFSYIWLSPFPFLLKGEISTPRTQNSLYQSSHAAKL